MMMDLGEIVRTYKAAKDPKEQVKILAELNCTSTKAIAIILQDAGCQVDKRYLAGNLYERAPKASENKPEVKVEVPEHCDPVAPEPVDVAYSMKVYIAGPITGNDKAKEQFLAVQKWLEGLGFIALNPMKNTGPEYRDYINQGLRQLMTCNMICLLPGWQGSDGAMLERIYSETVGMPELMIPEKLWRKWSGNK